MSDDSSGTENESPNKPMTKKTKLDSFQFKRRNSDSDESNKKQRIKSPVSESKLPKPAESISHIEGDIHSNWTHNKLEFLKPGKIKDKSGHKMDHPDYDPHTLYVPEDFLNKQTPAMRQWWVLKSEHFDSVLFFKVGKFYELYHMDAVVGVQQLGFTYMKVNAKLHML